MFFMTQGPGLSAMCLAGARTPHSSPLLNIVSLTSAQNHNTLTTSNKPLLFACFAIGPGVSPVLLRPSPS